MMVDAARKSVGVVVVTYNARSCLRRCLEPIQRSALRPKILVIDSSSSDGTADLARELGADVHVIPKNEFNHGITREIGRRMLGTDIAVMVTQDISPIGSDMIETLVEPILSGKASIAFARQLPHDGAGFFEAFPRRFNYPPENEIRGLEDIGRLGSMTYFCSDSCCSWSNAALDSIGGFRKTLTMEDTIATAMLLQAGHRIAYVGNAAVMHSHHYTLKQEFCRYFDTGIVRAQWRSLFALGKSDEERGKTFFSSMLRELAETDPAKIPYAVLSAAAKYLGYKIGYYGRGLPLWLKIRLSAQSFYWRNAVPLLPEQRETSARSA